jgi:regulation of enolase protein 1 (concanavalin A-like superfamily)
MFRPILLLLPALLIASPVLRAADEPAPPAQEAPKDPNLIPGWGKWTDADRDCKYRLDAGKLSIWVPGTAHDLSVEQNKMNAPMVLQDVQGDFSIQVQVSGTFAPGAANVAGRTPYQGAGLVLAADNRNYLRMERAVYKRGDGQNFHYVNFEVRLNGQVVRLGQVADFQIEDRIPMFLRLDRRGTQVQGYASEDGENWQSVGTKTFVATPKLIAGVAAVNASTTPFTPQYSSLKLTTATTK